ncbi:MAG: hypothetical protein QGH20_01155 [Candidatus Latescibacteria bacterium]|nr:hypothetical protein [Candidatus Latescibacterota bacterium]
MSNRSEAWHVVGLFNWGELNDENDSSPSKDIAVRVEKLGLNDEQTYLAYEFWSRKFLGTVRRKLSVEVPSHQVAVVPLKPRRDHPQFLSRNRHISQGATDIVRIRWAAPIKTLRGLSAVVEGFHHRYTIAIPRG